MLKKFLPLAVSILSLSLVFAGCGNSKQTASSTEAQSSISSTSTGTTNLLDKIKAEGKIRIGTEGTYIG